MGSSLSRHQGSSIANQANNGEIESVSSSHISITDETDVDTHLSRFPEFCGLSLHGSSRRSRTRLYQVWPAKNVFFAGGRFVCGPDPRGFLLTSVSIVLSIWAFCTNIGGPSNHSTIVLAVALGLSVIVFVNLILVGTRDPGIIPRNDEPPPEVGTSSGVRFRRLVIDGVEVKLKYCRICKIFRPPRSCHCIVCDNCVEKFDHHCLWIGQCIGLRNYRYYMMFILSAFVFFVYVCVFSWWRIGKRISEARSGVIRVVADEPETFAVAVFSFFAIWFLGGLSAFHVLLIFKNQKHAEIYLSPSRLVIQPEYVCLVLVLRYVWSFGKMISKMICIVGVDTLRCILYPQRWLSKHVSDLCRLAEISYCVSGIVTYGKI